MAFLPVLYYQSCRDALSNHRRCPRPPRFGFHPHVKAFVLLSSLTLSVLSSLDCSFLVVNLPGNEESGMPETSYGVGLWSYESPTVKGECVRYSVAYERQGGITGNDDGYAEWGINYDRGWSISRVAAICGLISGLVSNAVIWWRVCLIPPPPLPGTPPRAYIPKGVLLQAILMAFLCEGIKFGCFFRVGPCSLDSWMGLTIMGSEEATSSSGEEGLCTMARGSYASLACFISYFATAAFLFGFMVHPKFNFILPVTSDDSEGQGYSPEGDGSDVSSIPSYLRSLGSNLISGTSTDENKTNDSSSGSRGGTSRFHWTPTASMLKIGAEPGGSKDGTSGCDDMNGGLGGGTNIKGSGREVLKLSRNSENRQSFGSGKRQPLGFGKRQSLGSGKRRSFGSEKPPSAKSIPSDDDLTLGGMSLSERETSVRRSVALAAARKNSFKRMPSDDELTRGGMSLSERETSVRRSKVEKALRASDRPRRDSDPLPTWRQRAAFKRRRSNDSAATGATPRLSNVDPRRHRRGGSFNGATADERRGSNFSLDHELRDDNNERLVPPTRRWRQQQQHRFSNEAASLVTDSSQDRTSGRAKYSRQCPLGHRELYEVQKSKTQQQRQLGARRSANVMGEVDAFEDDTTLSAQPLRASTGGLDETRQRSFERSAYPTPESGIFIRSQPLRASTGGLDETRRRRLERSAYPTAPNQTS